MKQRDKGQVSREGKPNTLVTEVESSTEKTWVYPNELFHHRIEEINSELQKFDVVPTEKQRGEYERGAKQNSSVGGEHDLGCKQQSKKIDSSNLPLKASVDIMESLGEKQTEGEADEPDSVQKRGNWCRLQLVRSEPRDSLEIEVGKKRARQKAQWR